MTSSATFADAVEERAVARRITELPGDRSIAWAQLGAGPDCLVIHGTLMTLEDSLLGPASKLAERFRVTAVDRPGHGLSRRQRIVDASPWRQAELLHAFAVDCGLTRPVLIGHSFGGTVALAYALLFPEHVGGVVALAPMCLPELRLEAMLFGPRGIPGFGDGFAALSGLTADPVLLQLLWRAMFLPQVMPEEFAADFPFALAGRSQQMIAEGEDAVALMPALAAMAPRYGRCRVPTRILGGSLDIVVNNASQGQLAAALMADASFTWVPGAGHMLHHFAQERIVEAALSLRSE